VINTNVDRQAAREERRRQETELTKHVDMEQANEEGVVPIEQLMQTEVIDPVKHAANVKDLNKGQRRFFDRVTKDIATQKADGLKAQNSNSFGFFLSGEAGFGKSHLIRCLKERFTLDYGTTRRMGICITGSTGVAAKGVGGFTYHSVLHMDVQMGAIGEYRSLPDTLRSELGSAMQNVRLILFEECSMISSLNLLKIHMRLCEISGLYEKCECLSYMLVLGAAVMHSIPL
jgi:hypothetical protein